MNLRRIIIEEINNYILESDWNFHYSDENIQGYGEPYASDRKDMMKNGNSVRDTGNFGSGTYFSTFNAKEDKDDSIEKYVDNSSNKNPEFIKVDNNVYRVDFDIYKNLYRVETEEEGIILYSTLKRINQMFINISNKNYNNSNNYQFIKYNCKPLDLKCPSYKELTRMMQKYAKSNNVQSFSTYFMELNGFNGVNVSGIDKFDNSTHGSVIYDLSKKSLTPVNINKNVKEISDYDGFDSVANEKENSNAYEDSLIGKFNLNNDISNYSKSQQRRILLNIINTSSYILNNNEISKFDEDVVSFYMKYLYMKRPSDRYHNFEYYFYDKKLYEIVNDYDLYYWVNYDNDKINILIYLLDNAPSIFDNDDKELYLNTILKQLKRNLNDEEKEYIENEYYD